MNFNDVAEKAKQIVALEGPTIQALKELQDLFAQYNKCDSPGCRNIAEWEGWSGHGLIRLTNVCDEHKSLLRGYKDEPNKYT